MAPLLLQVLDVVNGKLINEEKPGFVVWSTLVDKLSRATVHDSSLWSDIGRAIRAMLEGYPTYAPSLNLIRIGLTASESTTDADLASKIVKRKVAKVVLPPPLGAEESMLKETESWDDNNSSGPDHLENSDLIVQEFEHSIGPAPVPHQAFRRALQTSLRASDTKSAACIIESFTQVSTAYPLGAQADLFSLALLCFAQGNDVKNAKRLLLKMVEANMKPR